MRSRISTCHSAVLISTLGSAVFFWSSHLLPITSPLLERSHSRNWLQPDRWTRVASHTVHMVGSRQLTTTEHHQPPLGKRPNLLCILQLGSLARSASLHTSQLLSVFCASELVCDLLAALRARRRCVNVDLWHDGCKLHDGVMLRLPQRIALGAQQRVCVCVPGLPAHTLPVKQPPFALQCTGVQCICRSAERRCNITGARAMPRNHGQQCINQSTRTGSVAHRRAYSSSPKRCRCRCRLVSSFTSSTMLVQRGARAPNTSCRWRCIARTNATCIPPCMSAFCW